MRRLTACDWAFRSQILARVGSARAGKQVQLSGLKNCYRGTRWQPARHSLASLRLLNGPPSSLGRAPCVCSAWEGACAT